MDHVIVNCLELEIRIPITLKSKNPETMPRIDFPYFSNIALHLELESEHFEISLVALLDSGSSFSLNRRKFVHLDSILPCSKSNTEYHGINKSKLQVFRKLRSVRIQLFPCDWIVSREKRNFSYSIISGQGAYKIITWESWRDRKSIQTQLLTIMNHYPSRYSICNQ